MVRQQVAAGADVIKMYGSTGSGRDVTGFETFTFEEMKAAADAAHALGKRIAIHTYGPDGRARCGAGGGGQRGARDRHGRRDDRGDGAAQDVLCADDRPQSLLRGQLSEARTIRRGRWTI